MGTWHKTEFRGVRYRKHPTRKHGVKFDRYFVIRYQRDGKRKEEGLGWGSDGWSAEKAALTLAELKNAYKTGEGPTRLKEKRQIAKERKSKDTRDQITFGKVFTESYYPQAQADKDPQSYKREKSLFKKWINPVLSAETKKSLCVADAAFVGICKRSNNAGGSPGASAPAPRSATRRG